MIFTESPEITFWKSVFTIPTDTLVIASYPKDAKDLAGPGAAVIYVPNPTNTYAYAAKDIAESFPTVENIILYTPNLNPEVETSEKIGAAIERALGSAIHVTRVDWNTFTDMDAPFVMKQLDLNPSDFLIEVNTNVQFSPFRIGEKIEKGEDSPTKTGTFLSSYSGPQPDKPENNGVGNASWFASVL